MSTVLHRLAQWAKEDGSAAAQRYKEGNEWRTITAQEYCDRVYYLALFLESRGMSSSDIGVILSYNCPQWVHMDLAPLMLGAKSAGLYPNASEKDIQFILQHTEPKVFSVQNKTYFEKAVGKNNERPLPDFVEVVMVFEGDTSFSPKAISYEDALKEGKKLAEKKKLEQYLDGINHKDGAFMIYTSGTTGDPKGAVLSHENIVFMTDAAAKQWKLPPTGRTFSFLPLCHIAEKMQNIGVGISFRYAVNYCSGFENIVKELPDANPTLLFCVPRVWEKMMEGVQAKLKKATGVKKKLAGWAFQVGERVAEAKYSGRTPSPIDLVQYRLADKIILSKIRKALGMDQLDIAASGAAALGANIIRWFRILNIEILEVFGQTESTGVICMTEPGRDCAGTVGKPLPGVDFKIADDGEILARGKNVFIEYYKSPESTASTVMDGWLYTGDLGAIENGLVKIIGRKKEIMKTSGGKMVAPVPIEESLKDSPVISQACLVGDGKKYFSALITLSENLIGSLTNGDSTNGVVKNPEILSQVKAKVSEVNSHLAGFEQVKYFTVLSNEFSVEKGEMTPTLKMKRNIIEQNYDNVINEMYQ